MDILWLLFENERLLTAADNRSNAKVQRIPVFAVIYSEINLVA